MMPSSNVIAEHALDTMLIVYSLIAEHPAGTACEQFIRSRSGWFTTTLNLLEAKAVLTKVYGVDPVEVSLKLTLLSSAGVLILPTDRATAVSAFDLSDVTNIDLVDAVLLETAKTRGAMMLASDDRKLARACGEAGITVENPIPGGMRKEIADWETVHLPDKGLPRILRRVQDWLIGQDGSVAVEFWSATGAGSHLP